MNIVCPNCHEVALAVPNTERQKEVLDYIEEFSQQKGFRPSMAQIARHIGSSSRATAHKHVRALKTQGFLTDETSAHRVDKLITAIDKTIEEGQ